MYICVYITVFIYKQEAPVEEADIDHLFMKSKLCGNNPSILKELKDLHPSWIFHLQIAVAAWVFFMLQSEKNDTGQVRKG